MDIANGEETKIGENNKRERRKKMFREGGKLCRLALYEPLKCLARIKRISREREKKLF